MSKQQTVNIENGNGAAPEKVERTSAGLRTCLFNVLDRLLAGTVTPSESNAVSMLVHKINQSVLMEIQVAKYAASIGHKGATSLPSIDLHGSMAKVPDVNDPKVAGPAGG